MTRAFVWVPGTDENAEYDSATLEVRAHRHDPDLLHVWLDHARDEDVTDTLVTLDLTMSEAGDLAMALLTVVLGGTA